MCRPFKEVSRRAILVWWQQDSFKAPSAPDGLQGATDGPVKIRRNRYIREYNL